MRSLVFNVDSTVSTVIHNGFYTGVYTVLTVSTRFLQPPFHPFWACMARLVEYHGHDAGSQASFALFNAKGLQHLT